MTGMTAKLYGGGGDEIDHSSVGASQGFGPATAPAVRLRMTVDQQQQNTCSKEKGADRDHKIVSANPQFGRVGVDPARHTHEPDQVHREERQIEPDKHGPERPFSHSLVHHAAGHFGKPEMNSADDRENVDAQQHVVKMCDDEVGVGQLPVECHRGGHEAGYASDDEQQHEAGEEQERRLELRSSGPDRCDPRKDGDRARDRDNETRGAKERKRDHGQTGRKHMMHPNAEAKDHRRDGRDGNQRIADQRTAAEHRQSVGNDAHAG